MTNFLTTAKYGLRRLTGSNPISDIDAGIQALAEDVDSKMVGYSQGPISSRPPSTGGAPGIGGRRYRALDTGQEFIDTGSSWVEILLGTTITQAWDPPSVADGASTSVLVPITVAAFSGLHATFSQGLPAGAFITCAFDGSASARVTLFNFTGSALDLAAGNIIVTVLT